MNSKFSIDPQRFIELEYGQIKSEILKRIELRQQLIQITLTFGGVLIGTGVQTKNILLSSIYPPLALCFVMLWAQNDIRSRQLGQYIYQEIENKTIGWENFYTENFSNQARILTYPLSILAPGTAFIISELIAIILLILYSKKIIDIWMLIAFNILCLLATIFLVNKVLKNRKDIFKLRK